MKARDVIRAIAAKHNLQPRDLLGHDRFGHFIKARREAAQTLRAMGHSYKWIGRQMNRDHTTIIQHCNPKYAARKKAYYQNYWRRSRSKEARA